MGRLGQGGFLMGTRQGGMTGQSDQGSGMVAILGGLQQPLSGRLSTHQLNLIGSASFFRKHSAYQFESRFLLLFERERLALGFKIEDFFLAVEALLPLFAYMFFLLLPRFLVLEIFGGVLGGFWGFCWFVKDFLVWVYFWEFSHGLLGSLLRVFGNFWGFHGWFLGGFWVF